MKMNTLRKVFAVFALFVCIPVIYAQDCDPSKLSPKGLKHLQNASTYVDMIMQGTEKQAIAELEAVLQIDSLWCPDLYFRVGFLCEYTAKQKDATYYDKSILYYKIYNSLMPSDSVAEKIRQLETIKKGLSHSLGSDAIKQGIKNDMVLIEGMLNEDTTDCIHSFYLGRYELTQKQWQSVMNNNPSFFRVPNNPVEQICNKYDLFFKELNRLTGANYRLPTSTEWFYAARGGKNIENYVFSGGFAENKVAWFSTNSGDRTHEVGGKEPNSLGLYDMSGNVSELVKADNMEEQAQKHYYSNKAMHHKFSKEAKDGDIIPVGGNYRSAPYHINDDEHIFQGMEYVYNQGESYYANERRKNQNGFYQDYPVKKIISSNIGIRLAQDVDIADMSTEEQQWDTWIQQKAERLQKKKEKELKDIERKRWGRYRGTQFGLNYSCNFNAYGGIEKENVFINSFFRHSMVGINLRIPIGSYIYIEPQAKLGIESDWQMVSNQEGFINQLSTSINNVQVVHVELPLTIGGVYYVSKKFAVRGYMAGQFCPHIYCNNNNRKEKPYYSFLFGAGLDLGWNVTADLYYRIPIKTESSLTTRGFTVSLGFLF